MMTGFCEDGGYPPRSVINGNCCQLFRGDPVTHCYL